MKEQLSNVEQNGFDRGYTLEKLVGMTIIEEKLHFIVKWKNIKKVECVEATIVNEKLPQTVIAFYQKRCFWDDDLTPVNYE